MASRVALPRSQLASLLEQCQEAERRRVDRLARDWRLDTARRTAAAQAPRAARQTTIGASPRERRERRSSTRAGPSSDDGPSEPEPPSRPRVSPRRRRKFHRRALAAAERIRRDERWRRCTCESAAANGGARCARCYGELAL